MYWIARQRGLEPLTHSLEGCCSIQLSYWRKNKESGREDSNLRFLAPKASALATRQRPERLRVYGKSAMNVK